MKTLFLCLFLSILVTLPTQAEVIVYKTTQKTRYVGNSVDVRLPATGFIILDADNLTGHSVGVFSLFGDKIFTVSPFERNLRAYSLNGPRGRIHSGWVATGITNKVSQFQDAAEYSIGGADADLAISPTKTVRHPRTIQISYGGVVIPTGGQAVMAIGSGNASYSQKETRFANGLAETTAGTLARIRETLLEKGYREVVEEP